MTLATVQNDGHRFHIRRLSAPFVADIKSGIGLWLVPFIGFFGFYLFIAAFNIYQRRTGSTPIAPSFSVGDLLIFMGLAALIILVNLAEDFRLLSPQTFDFDRQEKMFFVDGRKAGRLDTLSLRLQDSFGPSRRAFRIVVTAWESDYVIAQTRRVKMGADVQKEYPDVAISESFQRRYWFHQWADYTGAKTGFSRDWPDYQEIFALYAELTKFLSVEA